MDGIVGRKFEKFNLEEIRIDSSGKIKKMYIYILSKMIYRKKKNVDFIFREKDKKENTILITNLTF